MLYAMLTLIGLQLLGDMFAEATSVPVPGMVIGLLLLFGGLWIRGRVRDSEHAVPEALNRVAKVLHDNLGLLFVPAGAGIIANTGSLAADGVGLVVAVLISTVATIAITGFAAGWRRTYIQAQAAVEFL
jgi:holin-like protein